MLYILNGIFLLFVLMTGQCHAAQDQALPTVVDESQIDKLVGLKNKDNAITQLESLLAQPNLSTEQQISIYYGIVTVQRELGDFRRGIDTLNKIISLTTRHNLLIREAAAQKTLGVMLYLSGENGTALLAYQRALSLYSIDKAPLAVANLYNNIGLVQAAIGQSKRAMDSYNKAKLLYQKFGSARDRIDIYFNIAGLYSRLQRFDVAITMLHKVIEERQSIDDEKGIAMAYGDLGIAYFNRSNYLQANLYYSKSLAYFEQTKQPYFIASQSHNISEVHNRLGHSDRAIFYANRAIQLGKESSNKYAYIGGLHTLAKAQFHQKKFTQALDNVSQALMLANKNKMPDRAMNYLSLKALIQAATFDIDGALSTHKRYVELTKQDKNRELEEQFFQYQIQQQSKALQQEMVELAQQKDIEMLRVKTIHQRRNMMFFAVLLLALVCFLIYRRRVEVKLTIKLEGLVSQRTQELELLTQDLKKANQVKSQFMANMSHEIRTPLTSIIGRAESIVSGEVELSELNQEVNIILGNSTHVLSIVNDILDLSTIEVNKLEMCYELHDIHVLVSEIQQLFCDQVKKKGLNFVVHHQLPTPLIVNIDRTRLKQILINLCSNAIKFTDSGEIKINLEQHDNQLICRVSDSGIGMERLKLTTIFHSFTQADNSISRRFGGSGLGLALSQQLAVMMCGNITVQSVLEQGSEFTLTLPCISEQTAAEQVLDAKVQHSETNLVGKILLAEDHDDNRALITRLLNVLGLDVIQAKDGHEAIELCNQHQPDLILMDIQMPEIDGIDAFKTLRSQGYSQPIIALTANAMPDEVDRYLDIGFDDYFEKPIQRSCFVSTIAYYLKQTVDKNELEKESLDDIDISDLAHNFVLSLPNEHDKLFKLLSAKNYDEIATLIHKVSGAASFFGYATMATLGKEIEQKIKLQQFDDIDKLINMLLAMLSRTSILHDTNTH